MAPPPPAVAVAVAAAAVVVVVVVAARRRAVIVVVVALGLRAALGPAFPAGKKKRHASKILPQLVRHEMMGGVRMKFGVPAALIA